MKNRKIQFEYLRVLGLALVVMYHYFYRYNEIYDQDNLRNTFGIKYWGIIGVSIFFMLFGYFILPKKSEKAIHFLIRKMKKLIPLYVISLIIIYFTLSIITLEGRSVSFVDLVLNITLINGYINTAYVDGAHWYLTIIFSSIFLIFLLTLFKKQNSVNWYIVWAIVATFFYSYRTEVNFINLFLAGFSKILGSRYVLLINLGITLRLFQDKQINIFGITCVSIIITSMIMLVFPVTETCIYILVYTTIIITSFLNCKPSSKSEPLRQ